MKIIILTDQMLAAVVGGEDCRRGFDQIPPLPDVASTKGKENNVLSNTAPKCFREHPGASQNG